VLSFPAASGKWQVSNTGGFDPKWRADGKELIYRAADQKLMAVDIQTELQIEDFRVQIGLQIAEFQIADCTQPEHW
jgi:hypothetical protein